MHTARTRRPEMLVISAGDNRRSHWRPANYAADQWIELPVGIMPGSSG